MTDLATKPLALAVIVTCGLTTGFLDACQVTGDTRRGAPAGVLPYACQAEGAQELLAFDPALDRRGWGHFGGGAQGEETLAQTAARELHEETNCAFTGPTALDLRGRSPSRWGAFHTFFAPVVYRSPERIAEPRDACRDVERSQWVWVDHAELVAALDGDGDGAVEMPTRTGEPERIALWAGAAASLRKALADGVLPKDDPCQVRR